jgi:Tfp pilus assembly pilus retraction ATPase PilT
MFDLHQALACVVQNEGSDLHVEVPARPMARFRGQLEPLDHGTRALRQPSTPRSPHRVGLPCMSSDTTTAGS